MLTKCKPIFDAKPSDIQEIVFSSEKIQKVTKQFKTNIKWNTVKYLKLLSNSTISNFPTIKLIEGNDLSINKNIKFKTLMLSSDLSDYSGACIVVKKRGRIVWRQ